MNKYLIISLIIITQPVFGQFGPQQIIDPVAGGITEIHTVDINNDGLKDVFVAQGFRHQVSYYLNQSNGEFGAQQILASNINLSRSLASGDFNGDGWQDIVSFGRLLFPTSEIYLFLNSSGTFPTRTTIGSANNPINGVQATDIDNDNDIDVIVRGDIFLAIYYNDGKGQFTENIVDTSEVITEHYTMSIGDLDGDGFKEIIIGGTITLIYKNTNGVISYDSARSASINNPFFNLIFLVEINDFDGDGDNDLLTDGNNNFNFIRYTNDGNGFFTMTQLIETNDLRNKSTTLKDLNNDGFVDILTSFPQSGQIMWSENDGAGAFGSLQLIHQGAIPFTEQVFSDDLNNDGRNDIIWAQTLSYHLNNTNLENLIFSNGFELE